MLLSFFVIRREWNVGTWDAALGTIRCRRRYSFGDRHWTSPKTGAEGLPIPMALIGFMGRDDGPTVGPGVALVVDAARRVHRRTDFAAWGLMLDCKGGEANAKLWSWCIDQRFTPAKHATA
jgi:hypothetical protein